MDIKPIETVYNGYRFRSRLEARWAVFFDAVGIKYQYEPEGFTLSDGRCYLPDFFLPEFDVFVEIKPNKEADDGKADRFANDYTNFGDPYNGIVICYGDPAENKMVNTFFSTESECGDSGGGSYKGLCAFMKGPTGEIFLVMYTDFRERSFGTTKNNYRIVTGAEIPQYQLFEAEAIKARQARFEHGETPEPGRTPEQKFKDLVRATEKKKGRRLRTPELAKLLNEFEEREDLKKKVLA